MSVFTVESRCEKTISERCMKIKVETGKLKLNKTSRLTIIRRLTKLNTVLSRPTNKCSQTVADGNKTNVLY